MKKQREKKMPNNENGYECFHCGHKTVYWQGDFSFEDYGIEGEGIINVCHCSNCGADIEYYVRLDDQEVCDESKTDTGRDA